MRRVSNFPVDINEDNFMDTLEKMKDKAKVKNIVSFMEEVTGPEFTRVILHERDEHMANVLKSQPYGSRIVAVVGIAHLEGIEKYLNQKGSTLTNVAK